jgi:hypothetical protein
MADTKITINGQQYDSPDAMPPEVRRMYEEAMKALAGGPSGGSTQVFTGQAGQLGGKLVVNRVVTVNNRTYRSVDELPPGLRQQVEAALSGTAMQVRPKTGLHVSVNMTGPQARSLDDPSMSRPPAPLPIEPSTLEARIRDIPVSLAILVVIGLVLWALLDR